MTKLFDMRPLKTPPKNKSDSYHLFLTSESQKNAVLYNSRGDCYATVHDYVTKSG